MTTFRDRTHLAPKKSEISRENVIISAENQTKNKWRNRPMELTKKVISPQCS